jgi:hypothetical protein
MMRLHGTIGAALCPFADEVVGRGSATIRPLQIYHFDVAIGDPGDLQVRVAGKAHRQIDRERMLGAVMAA